MKAIKLTQVTIGDFIFTIFLCGMSFVSDFPVELICIFLMGFYIRFIINYFMLNKDAPVSKGAKQ